MFIGRDFLGHSSITINASHQNLNYHSWHAMSSVTYGSSSLDLLNNDRSE